MEVDIGRNKQKNYGATTETENVAEAQLNVKDAKQ